MLCVLRNGKYVAATGTKGYRWLESEIARPRGLDCVDISYYRTLCDDAVDTINSVGRYEGANNFDIFVNGDISECRAISSNLPF